MSYISDTFCTNIYTDTNLSEIGVSTEHCYLRPSIQKSEKQQIICVTLYWNFYQSFI